MIMSACCGRLRAARSSVRHTRPLLSGRLSSRRAYGPNSQKQRHAAASLQLQHVSAERPHVRQVASHVVVFGRLPVRGATRVAAGRSRRLTASAARPRRHENPSKFASAMITRPSGLRHARRLAHERVRVGEVVERPLAHHPVEAPRRQTAATPRCSAACAPGSRGAPSARRRSSPVEASAPTREQPRCAMRIACLPVPHATSSTRPPRDRASPGRPSHLRSRGRGTSSRGDRRRENRRWSSRDRGRAAACRSPSAFRPPPKVPDVNGGCGSEDPIGPSDGARSARGRRDQARRSPPHATTSLVTRSRDDRCPAGSLYSRWRCGAPPA